MVLSSIVVNLVNWHGCVHDVWLDSLTVDHRLDGMLVLIEVTLITSALT